MITTPAVLPIRRSRSAGTLNIHAPLSENQRNCLRCPITLEVMRDPVKAADGYTYERRAIERVLQLNPYSANSPQTGAPLAHLLLLPDFSLRSLISDVYDLGPLPTPASELSPSGFIAPSFLVAPAPPLPPRGLDVAAGLDPERYINLAVRIPRGQVGTVAGIVYGLLGAGCCMASSLHHLSIRRAVAAATLGAESSMQATALGEHIKAVRVAAVFGLCTFALVRMVVYVSRAAQRPARDAEARFFPPAV